MHPYFIFKDAITVFVFLILFCFFVFFSPNTLGHPDNYIPGNPLVTPASISILLLIVVLFKWLDPSLDEDWNNKEILDKEEILKLLNEKDNVNNNEDISSNEEEFKELINGLFQAEGNVYYEFYSLKSQIGRVKWSISLNGSEGSIKIFKRLNKTFENKLKYNIFKTSNNRWHVSIFTQDLDLILNKIIPYYDNIYGDKYRSKVFLIKIKYLLDILKTMKYKDNKEEYIDYLIKVIVLVYNIVDNSQRQISLEEKLELVLEKYNDKDYYNDYYKLNKDYYREYPLKILETKLNKKFNVNYIWLLGFFLGDGNILIYIRNEKLNLWLINILRITQKKTVDNENLFNLIEKFLEKDNIKLELKDKNDNTIEMNIDNKKDLKILLTEWLKYPDLLYNKKLDILYLNKILSMFKISKYWGYGKLVRFYILKEYKTLKYKNLSKSSLKLQLLSIEEIMENLKEGILSYTKEKYSLEEQKELISKTLDKEYIKSRLMKDKLSDKYYYFHTGNNTTKLLLYTRMFYYIIKKDYISNDIDDLNFISNYKGLGYVVNLPIIIKPKKKYYYYSVHGSELALLRAKVYKYTHLIENLKKFLNKKIMK